MSRLCPSIGMLVVALWASPVLAQQTQLSAPFARITDKVIQRDYSVYEAMQARLKAINENGLPVRNYALSKAQCWLDVSFHEYTRNDRSAFPQAALTESEKLVVAMESNQSTIPKTTELVNNAARLRPDLWARLDAMKGQTGFTCAQHQIACAEVELVHAGNEYNQQQWRHAKPYVQIAEDLIAEGTVLAERCEVPQAVAVPPKPSQPPRAARSERLVASAVFRFDRSDARDILPASLSQIDALVAQVKSNAYSLLSIRLVGFADRLNGTRDANYNQRLSERRSRAVREVLIARGLPAASIDTTASGDTVQIEACAGKFASKAELEACLQPNRRVEVQFEVVPRVR